MNTTKSRTIGILGIIFAFALVGLPLIASAQVQAPSLPYWAPNGLVSCTGNLYNYDAQGNATPNPNACTNLCNLVQTAVNVIYFIMTVALFIIAPVLVMIGAIMIIFAGANPGMLENGKKTLTSTVIGIVIVLAAYLIVSAFLYAMTITGVGGFGGPSCTPPPSSFLRIEPTQAALTTAAFPAALLPTAFAQTQILVASSVPNANPSNGTSPGGLVANLYLFALMAGGVLAFGAVVYGGILYLTSAGNPSRQGEGSEWIESALIGILLLAGAYLVLEIVNPALLNLTLPSLPGISISGVSVPPTVPPTVPPSVPTGVPPTGCAGGQCETLPNCTPSARVNCGGAAGMVNTLNCINQADSNFTVSEGYPPGLNASGQVQQHISKCHNDGCCVDTTVPGGSSNCSAVNALISAAKQCGATELNEYPACTTAPMPATWLGPNVHINSASGGGC